MTDQQVENQAGFESTDWETEFDHFSPVYAADPYPIWRDLRERRVIARSSRFRGMWVPTSHRDIVAVANDPATFSSRSPIIAAYGALADFRLEVPPISSDPPYHTEVRRLLLPFFGPKRINAYQPQVEELAHALIDQFIGDGRCDAATQFARFIPVRIIASMLGVPLEDESLFLGWVHQLLEVAPTNFEQAALGLMDFFSYFLTQVQARRTEPRDDLISFLLEARLGDRPLNDQEILGMCLLLLLAGIDTTWSAIGATIWHLAQHPEQRQYLRENPDCWPIAREEFLRAYAPVTMAREVNVDTEVLGCPMKAGEPLLLPFPAANRDPEVFPDPDTVDLNRSENRHLAFGVGIHRCLGSNLARMELETAVRVFLDRIPEFELEDPDAVRWSVGQVRGPRVLTLVFPT
ncbi:MAG: cytochrome P450 [Acidimicrobiales bacterium]|nr:cytochrome P450 [Acidimicrobiales bacterium]